MRENIHKKKVYFRFINSTETISQNKVMRQYFVKTDIRTYYILWEKLLSLYLVKHDVNIARKNLIRKIYMNKNERERDANTKQRHTILECQGDIPRLKRVLLPWKWWPHSGRRNISNRGETAQDDIFSLEAFINVFSTC